MQALRATTPGGLGLDANGEMNVARAPQGFPTLPRLADHHVITDEMVAANREDTP